MINGRYILISRDKYVEQPYDDALKAVRTAIRKNSHIIILSCGKLITGVTVKEWTGVMLLSDSSSTGAADYMQIIFRIQSAGSIDGMQKKICYTEGKEVLLHPQTILNGLLQFENEAIAENVRQNEKINEEILLMQEQKEH